MDAVLEVVLGLGMRQLAHLDRVSFFYIFSMKKGFFIRHEMTPL